MARHTEGDPSVKGERLTRCAPPLPLKILTPEYRAETLGRGRPSFGIAPFASVGIIYLKLELFKIIVNKKISPMEHITYLPLHPGRIYFLKIGHYLWGVTFGTGTGEQTVTPRIVHRLAFLCLPRSQTASRDRQVALALRRRLHRAPLAPSPQQQ